MPRIQQLLGQFNGTIRSKRLTQQRLRRASKRALRAKYTAAVAQLNQQTAFLAAVSHDLRQPLHAIGLFLSALEQQLTRISSTDPQMKSVEALLLRLNRSMLGVDDQVNRLLDLSRLQGGAIIPMWQTVNLIPLVQSLEARFSPLAVTRGLRFRLIAPDLAIGPVRTDPALLVEVLMNLLSNAFRYTEKGAVALVLRRRSSHIELQIRDSGRGMSPYQADFAPLDRGFNRALDRALSMPSDTKTRQAKSTTGLARGNPTAAHAGLGLGLSIVTQLGHALNMPISYRSREEKGTCISLILATGVTSSEPLTHYNSLRAEQLTTLRGLLILVVDDDLDVLIAMESALTGCGIFVLVARNLDEARRVIDGSDRYPDILITDHQVGLTDSTQIISQVRSMIPTPIRVIVITGDTSAQTLANIRANGYPVLSKPQSLDLLLTELVQLVARKP